MDPSVNHNTFEEGIVGLYPRLFPLALRLCRNRADAHDLVQDTVERGLRCRDLFRTGEEPPRWEAFSVDDVRRALMSVDPAWRETFWLFAFGNLPQDEIAQRLSISRQTVATRVFRTRGKLREIFASDEYQQLRAAV